MGPKPIIKVQNLTKKFGKLTAVDSISFEVEEGEIFAFLGPNGAGKTTTIKMLTTLLDPTSGEMSINGYNPMKDKDDTRKSFGIVFQDPSLDDELTTYENMYFHAVLYGVDPKTQKQSIEDLLKFVELWDRRDDQVKTFSGGMKRRLEIARALLHMPKLVFLDEPTLGLDPQTRNHIWSYIKDLNKNDKTTIFFTTHYLEEAEKTADRIAIIDKGKIVALGTAKQLEKKTKTHTLEEAYLKLTGYQMREQEGTIIDKMRMSRKMMRR